MNNFMVESGDESINYIWAEISLQPCNTGYLTLDTFEGRIYMEVSIVEKIWCTIGATTNIISAKDYFIPL